MREIEVSLLLAYYERYAFEVGEQTKTKVAGGGKCSSQRSDLNGFGEIDQLSA